MKSSYVQCKCDRCGRMAVLGGVANGTRSEWRALSLDCVQNGHNRGVSLGDLCPVCIGALHRWMAEPHKMAGAAEEIGGRDGT